ncbi:MAG: hypothetical protein HWE10_03800 [Gammaproteobacteria bacterium]|nr:hypothetical protein [Gammaproteobacteria bacterium]
MRLNTVCSVFAIAALGSSMALQAKSKEDQYVGFNYSHFGVQNLTYKETLDNFAAQGDLSSEFDVSNVVLTAASYTHLFDNVGFLLSIQPN